MNTNFAPTASSLYSRSSKQPTSRSRSTLASSTSSRSTRRKKKVFAGVRDLDQLKEEFEKECGELEKKFPELKWRTTDGWERLHKMLQDRDIQDVKNHNENIDTLLVFAGLYSAILTAFVIEAYKLLQPDPAELSLNALVQISQQLGSFVLNPGFVNSTQVPFSLPTTSGPSQRSLWVNGLWFTALVLGLITASLGMLVKQWLREFLDNTYVSPEERRRVRLFRIRGLRNYKVSEIAAFLPILLQASLLFFFVGLAVFTHTVNTIIGWVISTIVIAWGAVVIITTVIPLASSQCPYKTPLLKPLTAKLSQALNAPRAWLRHLAQMADLTWLYNKFATPMTGSKGEREASQDESLDVEVLLDAYRISRNINVWEMVTQCVDLDSPSPSLDFLSQLLVKKHPPSETDVDVPQNKPWEYLSRDECYLLVKSMAMCLRWRYIRALEGRENLETKDIQDLHHLTEINETLVGEWFSQSDASNGLQETIDVLVAMQETLLIPSSRGCHFEDISSKIEKNGIVEIPTGIIIDVVTAFTEDIKNLDVEVGDRMLRGWCLSLFRCMGQITEEHPRSLKNRFHFLTTLLAEKVNSLTDSEGSRDPEEVFQWHCALDMAIRLYRQSPNIIDKQMFEALHARSVEAFNEFVGATGLEEYIIEERTPTGEAGPATSPVIMDWDTVLEQYADVEVRRVGGYQDLWSRQRLWVDCKHRMEFMLHHQFSGSDQLRSMVELFRF